MALLSRSDLKTLIEANEEWCVSLYMPAHRAGPPIQQDPIRLKGLLNTAQERLEVAGYRSVEARDLLAPAGDLIDDADFWRHQGDGLALFLAPGVFRDYRLPVTFDELLVVADRFHVKPLLPLLAGDGRYHLLAISQGEVRLFQGSRDGLQQVEANEMPKGVAGTLRYDIYGGDTERRARGGLAGGQRPGQYHGQGDESESADSSMRRYVNQVAGAVETYLGGDTVPLVLAGAPDLLPYYREANKYPYLVEQSVTRSVDGLSAEELHALSWPIVQPIFSRGRQAAEEMYRKLAGEGDERATADLTQIVPAAYYGRVDTLFVARDQQQWGTFDPQSNRVEQHDEAQPGDDDLYDLAAVHTLLNGGSAYVVDAAELPSGALASAVLRY